DPQLTRLHAVLTSPAVQSLLRLHPNELAIESGVIPPEWKEWPNWSKDTPRGWLELVHYYMTPLAPIPSSLRALLEAIRGAQLPRQAITLDVRPVMKETGMSPKKAHEVFRMVAYVLEIIKFNEWDISSLRMVDVGAGQGYLTRALKAQLPQTRILALDADEAQTIGAQRWEERLLPPSSEENPSITHKTIHITPENLFATIDEWISEGLLKETQEEIPVLLIGLHACGSLTPDVIRTFSGWRPGGKPWRFAAAVVVGCCYNLMNPDDFPLSRHMQSLSPLIDIPTSAYHLAAQIPTQWLTSLSPPSPSPSVEMALRKVTWRALLGRKLQRLQGHSTSALSATVVNINLTPGRQLPWSRLPVVKVQNFDQEEVGTGATPAMRRLGRLRDHAYQDWDTFLDVAGKKMGVKFANDAEGQERDAHMERLLEVVHTLRCLIGPVVESAIILDRLAWIEENLGSDAHREMRAEIVNLFDQATGSGRNIAIVIAPSIPSLS
ncbi:Protein RRNAD1, partial [Leucoagaricus sp. SymC.cos]